MKEHPIPQDVTGYKFHIVGNMTVGQFLQLVAGAVLAFMIYSTNLYDIIKWPLMLLVFGLGAMAAFVPIAERPLSHWITTFIMVLNRPTKFFWRREARIPDYFTFVSSSNQKVVLPEVDLTPLRRQKIHEYIDSARTIIGVDQETQQVQLYVDHIGSLFSTTPVTTPHAQPELSKPNLKVRLRSMRSAPSSPISTEIALSTEEKSSDDQEQKTIGQDLSSTLPEITTYTSEKILQAQSFTKSQEQKNDRELLNAIPKEEVPTIEHAVEQQKVEEKNAQSNNQTITQLTQQEKVQPNPTNTTKATFNTKLPFPSKPTVPNKLVGMVLSANNDLLEGAIVEIKNTDGSITRAVRTNALGQFFVTTPLNKGKYVITVDKSGFTFEPISIELKGKILEPLEIRSV